VAVAAVAIGLLPAACGGDGTPAAGASDRPESPARPPATAPASHADHVVDVTAVDFAFEGLPRTVERGTRLTLRNDAPAELHELVAFRLPDAERRPAAELLALPPAELGAVLGDARPATVLLTPPGGDTVAAVGDGTLDDPGRYLVMCSIPTGVDPAEYLAAAAAAGGEQPQVAGGPPHFVHGMATELVVAP
jgi:hypothetical protein